MKNKKLRYWIFAGEECYPSGGMYDVQDSFDTFEECHAWWKGFNATGCSKWCHLYDSKDDEIVSMS